MTAAAETTRTPHEVSRSRAEAVIDLDAITVNVARLREHVGGRDVMAVVKADGYGHGIIESARAARAGGASWLGVAFLDEALQLRASGDSGRLLSWLAVPGSGMPTRALRPGTSAAAELKLDSGLGRGGSSTQPCAPRPRRAAGPSLDSRADSAVRGGCRSCRRRLHLANSGGALASPRHGSPWFAPASRSTEDGDSPVPLTAHDAAVPAGSGQTRPGGMPSRRRVRSYGGTPEARLTRARRWPDGPSSWR